MKRVIRLPPEDRASGTQWTGSLVGHTIGLENLEKRNHCCLPEIKTKFLGCPARNLVEFGIQHLKLQINVLQLMKTEIVSRGSSASPSIR
jgi:hypothetical protein